MIDNLNSFEQLVRNAWRFGEAPSRLAGQHPFEERDIHSALPAQVRRLFDDAHFAQATFEACKFFESEVRKLSSSSKSGEALMLEALNELKPTIRLAALSTVSQRDEQRGYKWLFAGVVVAIRNPRGHEHSVNDDVGTCLDHLSLVSQLLRRLERAGYSLATP